MSTSTLRRGGVVSVIAALLTTFTLAACGGDSSSDSTGTTGSSGATSTSGAAATTGTTGGAATPDGAQIFAATCASCHTLKAADSSGQTGPNLDELMPDEATVEQQVTNGGGGMPSYKDQLSPAEITAVSKYVADNAGK